MPGVSLESIVRKHETSILKYYRSPGSAIPHIDQPNGLTLMRVQVEGVWKRVGVEGIDSHEDTEVVWL